MLSDQSQSLNVFMSYARADRARVEKLAAILEARGISLWWDKMIEGGSAFAREIEERLETADAVVVVWSRTSVESDWVLDEAGHGRDRKRLVPVSLDGTPPPLGFRQYHAVSLADWRGNADGAEIDELLRGIAAAAGAPEPARTSAAPVPGARINRRAALVAGGMAVVAGAGGLAWWKGLFGTGTSNSVAVLPFKNLSGDANQEYFSDGLSEEIRTTLARNSALQVAAPASVAEVVARPDDAKAIGAKLGVSFLLEGSVRRAGDVARIAAELIDTSTGFSRWSQSFDRSLTDIFAVQTEIANVVAEALSLRVTKLKPQAGGTRNIEAYEAYLRGLSLFRSDKDEASDREAVTLFTKALQIDPAFALARVYLARSEIVLAALYAPATEAGPLFDKALAEARQAVKEAPELAHAQLALGLATMYGQRAFDLARAPYDEAYKLGSGDANIAIPYALYSSYIGQSQVAIAATEQAMRLDPLNPSAFRYAALARYHARQYPEAIALYRRAIEMKPDIRGCYGQIGYMLALQGKLDEAKTEFDKESLDQVRKVGLAIVAFRKGDAGAASRLLSELDSSLGDNASALRAVVFAQSGRVEEAIAALEKGCAVRDSGLSSIKVDPMLDPIRKDPRFSRLLSGMGLG